MTWRNSPSPQRADSVCRDWPQEQSAEPAVVAESGERNTRNATVIRRQVCSGCGMELLPRDAKFFELLGEQAQLVREASNLLEKGVLGAAGGGDFAITAGQVRNLERKGREALSAINRRLHKTFITPIDPEDITYLSTMIDEVLNQLDAAAYRMDAFGLGKSTESLPEAAAMARDCVDAMCDAVEALGREDVWKSGELTEKCEEVNRRGLDSENRIREIVRKLFARERDAIALIKQKEVFEMLETTCDSCERVANILESIAIKNS